MKNSLSVDLSLDDPILPSSSSKARDMLLGKSYVYISDLQFLSRIYNSQVVPKIRYLNFDHPTMKSTYGSVSLRFEAVYSNVIIFHLHCDAAKQPTLKDIKLSVSSYNT